MAEASQKPDPEEWESLVDRLWSDAPETSASNERPEILSIYAEDDRIPKSWQGRPEPRQASTTSPTGAVAAANTALPGTNQEGLEPAPIAARAVATWLWPALAMILALAVGWFASAPCPAISPDSVQYLSAARNIADGHGLTTSVTPLEITRTRVPFSAWPPLYPMILAVGERVGLVTWARIVNLLAFALTLIPLAVIGRELLGTRWLPFAPWRTRSSPRAGCQFVRSVRGELHALTTAFARAPPGCASGVTGSGAHDRRACDEAGPIDSTYLMLAAGLFAARWRRSLATPVPLYPGGRITVVAAKQCPPHVRRFRWLAAFLLPASSPLAAWCLRNQRLTGHLFGEIEAPGDRTSRRCHPHHSTVGDWILLPIAASSQIEHAALWIAGAAAVTLVLTLVQRFGPEMTERSARRDTTPLSR
ncbi:MAG: hypothetical protein U0527_15070 [Candidatus Eisenbacteria bacterium]